MDAEPPKKTIQEAAHALWERTVGRLGIRSNVQSIGVGSYEDKPAIILFLKRMPPDWEDGKPCGDEDGWPVIAVNHGEMAVMGVVE